MLTSKEQLNRIRKMRQLHLQNKLLRILEDYRITHRGRRLSREEWLKEATKNLWVGFHFPCVFLQSLFFCDDAFKLKVEKVLNLLIPSSEKFTKMTDEEKRSYYVTYEDGGLEVTDKGMEFIDIGGYEQAVWEQYGATPKLIAWIISIIIAIAGTYLSIK